MPSSLQELHSILLDLETHCSVLLVDVCDEGREQKRWQHPHDRQRCTYASEDFERRARELVSIGDPNCDIAEKEGKHGNENDPVLNCLQAIRIMRERLVEDPEDPSDGLVDTDASVVSLIPGFAFAQAGLQATSVTKYGTICGINTHSASASFSAMEMPRSSSHSWHSAMA